MTDNMKIWDAVEKTDPTHTKTVNQRGGFTAIGANYQIMRATEQFGPIGIGWGYDCGEPIFNGTFIIIPLTFWHGTRDQKFGPIFGCAEISGKRPDHDAPKKATTDALTKALSQLGFNADVFLGKYDDNKYVAELKAEKARENEPPVSEQEVAAAIDSLTNCATVADLNASYLSIKGSFPSVAAQQRVIDAASARKKELSK